MPAPYILAKDLRTAHDFARETLGLERGRYRIVHSASTISSVRGTDLYLVPGWEGRYDRFAVNGALRYTRLNVIDGAEVAPPEPVGEPDDLVPAGTQLTLVSADEASAFFEQTSNGHNMVSEGAPVAEALEPVEAKKGKRRSRCKDCGTLHFKGEACAEQPLVEE